MAPRRRLVQWLTTILLLVVPFIRVGGESLLRVDVASRSILLFGTALRIDELYLFLIAVLILVFLFLFVTMVFGRVWCGWLCPQTTITDLAEFFDRRIERWAGAGRRGFLLRHGAYVAIALVVSANLVWYFIAPASFFSRLFHGGLGAAAGITLATTALVVYLDLALVRRSFCRDICPYGRIQLMTMDRNTLTLEFDPACAERCRRCNACVAACPMGIDIRDGLQVECINCGRCLDACRQIMAASGDEGLIHYTFGRREEGGGRPVNVRSLLMGGMLVILTAILAYAAVTRREASITVVRGGAGEVRLLKDGSMLNSYAAFLENRTRRDARYDIRVYGPPGSSTTILGPVRGIPVAANGTARVGFSVRMAPPPVGSRQLVFYLVRGRAVVASARALFLVR